MLFLKWFLRFTWELPQTLLGFMVFLFLKLFHRPTRTFIFKDCIYSENFSFGVSLGAFVFGYSAGAYQLARWPDPIRHAEDTKRHEYGHAIQSRYLGPLYLLIVGIPSLVGNILTQWKVLRREDYYKRFPEDWADKLGGVDRRSF